MEKYLSIEKLGTAEIESPIKNKLTKYAYDKHSRFVSDTQYVASNVEIDKEKKDVKDLFFEKAGPREKIFFNPEKTTAAIVTCGGLCPGLNNVIRSVFMELYHFYKVRNILGIRYGYNGFNPSEEFAPIKLTTEIVDDIHESGGTILGTSRGMPSMENIIEYLLKYKINILFCVGGDGTHRGAANIVDEIKKKNLNISVVGIPKTIDNDIPWVSRSFGYSTAVEYASKVIKAAHTEARGLLNGISLVKVMGRNAGFISSGATLASQEPNFVIIPEIPLILNGNQGFLNILKQRILKRKHAVIVVAEGAGQDLLDNDANTKDDSGNLRLSDIGDYLKKQIPAYFKKENIRIELKYFDPGYYIRSVPANSTDSILCDRFAREAVHAAMSGRTAMTIGLWNDCFIHVPIDMIGCKSRQIDLSGEFWMSTLTATGQPPKWFNNIEIDNKEEWY